MTGRPALHALRGATLALAAACLLLALSPARAQQPVPKPEATPAPPRSGAPALGGLRYADMDPAVAYRNCLDFARRDPEQAFEAAIAWRDEGGGAPSLHCVALALFGLGQYGEAADRLQTMAETMPEASDAQRARVFGQAGAVWLRANELTRAHAVFSKAIELDSGDPQLFIFRGESLARAGQYFEAIDDFTAALDLNPRMVDALTFRAAAYRLLEVFDLAHDDVKRALAIDPNQPDALVELGAILVARGERDGARQAWLKAIDSAPDSPAAEAARGALERLDVKVE